MRVMCAYSGIEFNCDHFPGTLSTREVAHPVFYLKQKALIDAVPKALAGEITPTDSYLLYLALFNSTDMVEFRTSAVHTSLTTSIVANNLSRLSRMVTKMNVIGKSKVQEILSLPSFVISQETATLSNTHEWIALWETNYDDYLTGYKSCTAQERLKQKEIALERLIKNKLKTVASYIVQLANWADVAGQFPVHLTPDENGLQVPLNEYWKKIIVKCSKNNNLIYSIPVRDLEELIQHCEDTVAVHDASIFSHTLMAVLRAAQGKQGNLIDLGDIDLSPSGNTFRILDENTSLEDANKLALIASAPTEKPIESNYPSRLAFLRARGNYEMAQEYKQNLANKSDSAGNEPKISAGDI